MSRLTQIEGQAAPEREPILLFPDCIEELIEERGHGQIQEDIDATLDIWPRYDQYLTMVMGEESVERRHDTALYCAYRLNKMGHTYTLESFHLSLNIEYAEKDGDEQVVEMTRRFADWAGLEIRTD